MLIKPVNRIELNAGYYIIKRAENSESKDVFVMGHSPKKDDYVTWWEVQPGDYIMGNYFNTRDEAVKDLIQRVKRHS